jgi:hypothetical protein
MDRTARPPARPVHPPDGLRMPSMTTLYVYIYKKKVATRNPGITGSAFLYCNQKHKMTIITLNYPNTFSDICNMQINSEELTNSDRFDLGSPKCHPSLSNHNMSPSHTLAMHGDQHRAAILGIPSN